MASQAHSGEGATRSLWPMSQSTLSRARALLRSYAAHGSLSPEERVEVAQILDRGALRGLPAHTGSQLESTLYLVRVGLNTLDRLAHDQAKIALKKLVSTLLTELPDAAMVEPFDGLLYAAGARLAHDCGDPQIERRMADGARTVATRLGNDADAIRALLAMLASDDTSSIR